MTLGVCLLADLAIDVHVESVHLFGWRSNVLLTHLVGKISVRLPSGKVVARSFFFFSFMRATGSFQGRCKQTLKPVISL